MFLVAQVPQDLAVNKPAFQSSTWSAAYSASKANNGDADTYISHGSCSHTAAGDPSPWWGVDLGAEYSVEYVVITNREDCCGKLK